jgi:hypothetical protein
VNYGAPHGDLRVFKQLDGTITLTGAIKNGNATAGQVLGTAPVGHRPAQRIPLTGYNLTATTQITVPLYVEPNGEIKAYKDIESNGLLAMNTTYPSA